MFTRNFFRVHDVPDWVMHGWRQGRIFGLVSRLNVFFFAGIVPVALFFLSFFGTVLSGVDKIVVYSLFLLVLLLSLHYSDIWLCFRFFGYIHADIAEFERDIIRLHRYLCLSVDLNDWRDHTGDEFGPGRAREKFLLDLRSRYSKSFEKRAALGELEVEVDKAKKELGKTTPPLLKLLSEALDAKVALATESHETFHASVKNDFEFAVKMGIFGPNAEMDELLLPKK